MTSVAFHADQPFARVPGGIGAYVRGLPPALAAADPDLDLTLFHARFDAQPDAWMTKFPMVQLRQRIRTLYPSWALLGRPSLPAPLDRADIVHAPLPSAVPPVGRRQRLVVTVHDLAFRLYPAMYPPPWRALYGLGLRRAIRHADILLTCSTHTADDLTRAGVAARRIRVTWAAPSLPVGGGDPGAALERLRIPRPYVLFVGTLEPRKNVARLIEAYRKAVGEDGIPHALVLAGPRGWRAEAVDRELALTGPGRIVRTGRVDPADLDALYRGADLFCYPSLYEGFGLPVVEAMARGIPVICSNTSSLPEVAGSAAVQVNPTSVEELAGAISAVLGDSAERARMAEGGPSQAATFSWERTAGETLQAYREAA